MEISEARAVLHSHRTSGGLVILIQRNIDDIMNFLQIDKTRPAYVDDMHSVWERRRGCYNECSSHLYYSQRSSLQGHVRPPKDLARFIGTITGRRRPLDTIRQQERSFFVSLTLPKFGVGSGLPPEIFVGSDAVELRVDLLHMPREANGAPSADWVANQLSILRGLIALPIIFTVRTMSQGGKFHDHDHESILALSLLALRMGVEFLDLEMQLPEPILDQITSTKGNTSVIASHHDPKGTLSWSNGSWVPFYNKALLYGDIIKLVGVARDFEDNAKLQQFRAWAQSANSTPIVAINMGRKGQLSRIQNTFLTPVTHSELTEKAAPGQLSVAEIYTALALHGDTEPKKFYLFGKPICQSPSPPLHNSLFQGVGLPHKYEMFESEKVDDLKPILGSEDFGGASVTIPLKLDIKQYLDSVSPDAQLIGAVNTIVPNLSQKSACIEGGYFLTGQNTDWKGMQLVLEKAGSCVGKGHSGLVIGAGGTARAAIYALHAEGFSPIYLVGRTAAKLEDLVRSFPEDYHLQVVTSETTQSLSSPPSVAIGTIPADQPINAELENTLKQILKAHNADKQDANQAHPVPSASLADKSVPQRVLLEMAYKPSETPLMEMARDSGWKTIPGREVLAAQAVYQFEAWTGIMPSFETGRVSRVILLFM